MVGSGKTKLGHHNTGVLANSCKCSSAVGERYVDVEEEEVRRSEGERGRERVARVHASRRVKVAVMKIGM